MKELQMTLDKEKAVREELIALTNKNIFIKAGAGAGKSTLMVERLVEQAKQGNQPFDETVAITFTNKAATDLEAKLMESVSNNKDLLEQLPDLTIGTIHSFCQKILDERPIEAGLSPGFAVIEDAKESEIILKRLLAEVMESEEPSIATAVQELRNLDVSPFDYYGLLESKVGYMELGIEEKETRLEQEEVEINMQRLMKEFRADLSQISNPEYIWYNVKPGKIPFLVQGQKNMSLRARINLAFDEHYHLKEEKLDDILSNIFLKSHIDKIRKDVVYGKMQDAYKESRETCIEEINLHIKQIFVEALNDIDFKDENWLTAFCKSTKEVVDNRTWMEGLKAIVKNEEKEQVKQDALFHYFTEVPIHQYNVEQYFGSPSNHQYELAMEADNSTKEKIDFFIESTKFKGKIVAETKEKISKLIDSYKKEVIANFSHYHLIFYYSQTIYQEVLKRYQQYKLEENIVSHNDLLRKTYELLQNEDARSYFHQKYKYIYIDEFQDTDPLQTGILFYLTSENNPKSLEDARPRPGSLFIVGDPKQSIYRFRNADLRLYDQVEKIAAFRDDWRFESLQINFRSDKYLIDWFNKTFKRKFEENPSLEIQPDYDDMLFHINKEKKSTSNDNNQNVFKLKIPVETSRGRIINEYSQKWEAERIANWIEQENSNNPAFKYSDVMIITPGNHDVIHYVNALKEKGIPTSFSGEIEVINFPEIVKLVSLIDYLVEEDRAKEKKLLGQNWNIPFTLQYEIEQALNKEKKNLAIDNYEEISKQVKDKLRKNPHYRTYYEAKDCLDYYAQLSKLLSPMNLLHRLVYDLQFGILPNQLTETEYESSLSILTTFIEGLPSEEIVSLADLSFVLNEQINNEETIKYEMIVKPKQEAVQIMNLHKTKGLDARVVFLASPKNKRKFNPDSFVDRSGEEEIVEHALFSKNYYGIVSTKYYSKSFLDMIPEMEAHEEAERIRLLYVAATRAEELLIIGQREVDDPETWDDLLTEDLPELTIETKETEKEYRYISVPPILEIEQAKEADEWLEAGTYAKKTPSGDRIKVDEDNREEKEASSEIMKAEKDFQLLHAYKGPLWGNIVHAAYELMIEHGLSSLEEGDIREIIGLGLEQYELTDKELAVFSEDLMFVDTDRDTRLAEIMANEKIHAAIQETVTPFFRNETYRNWLSDYEAYPEVAVQAWLDEDKAAAYYEEEKFVHVNGIIDLIMVNKTDENKIIIVDYKTNVVPEGHLPEDHHRDLKDFYASQLQTYARLMSDLYGKEVQAVYLYAVATDTFIPIETEVNRAIAERVTEK